MSESSYENTREHLEAIIDRVKDREIDLDEAITMLEEGIKLASACAERLADEASGRFATASEENQNTQEGATVPEANNAGPA